MLGDSATLNGIPAPFPIPTVVPQTMAFQSIPRASLPWLGRTFLVVAAWLAAGSLPAQSPEGLSKPDHLPRIPDNLPRTIDFSRDVRPILAKHCYACHGPNHSESGLRLDRFQDATSPAESGDQAIVPGQVDKSPLLRRVASVDESLRMPPEGRRLTEREQAILGRWIQDGAAYTDHWAFRRVVRPAIAPATPEPWASNPIDHFILKSLREADLDPSPPSEARRLIRRLYFDVLGVPPSIDEVEAFAANPSESAYLALVDRLLADPRMGERWGRHWLDLVRFAETNSFERDGPKPNAWKYRDYVIRSINADKPYDRFVTEQLAGDEMVDANQETRIAMGFYRLGIWDDEPADPQLARFDEYDDIVSTTGQAFLGLTVNCARCHDHKIDPIPQKDYYQLVAFFRDITSYAKRGDQRTNNQLDITDPALAQQYDEFENNIKRLQTHIKAIEKEGIVRLSAEDQRATEGPERQSVLGRKLQPMLSEEKWAEYQQAKEDLKSEQAAIKKLPQRDAILTVAKCDASPPETFVLLRGNPNSPGEAVVPAYPTLFKSPPPNLVSPNGNKAGEQAGITAGRRIHLAHWIASPDNLLTSRVIVNRLWQHHFGRGIVRSTNNFGQLGDYPTHPELLDWLATELVRHDWNLKAIHRLMLTSSTYRMSSLVEGPRARLAMDRDPDNDRFWRFNPRRLGAEEIRDAVLATSGQVQYERYGKSIYPEVAAEVMAGQSRPGDGWGTSSESDQARRSIYIYVKRSLIPPELANFDFPETDISCEARFLTTQPAQSLSMLNGRFMQRQADKLAARVRREAPSSSSDPVAHLIQLVYGRPALPDEVSWAQRTIQSLASRHSMPPEDALRNLCLILLNTNEFLYLD
jgi:mono/diheme cytochrome c family protein